MSICGLFLCTVIISALLLIHSTQKILINNATNYVDMASDKFSNELDVLCLQLDVIASHIQSDSLYQELLSTPDYHSLAPYTISEISQNVSYLKSLYPDIVDIAFANDLVHWSALFSESDLHTLYEEALNCSHIYSNGRSIGCAFISPDINKLNMEGFSQDSPASYFLMDTVGNLYPISAGSEYSDTILASCQDALQEAAKESSDAEHSLILNRHFSIQMDYSDTAQCYIISAVYILDIRMPGYSGLELSRIISQSKLKTQVIIVSGYAEFSYAQKAIQYGVLGYCLKPVEYDEITSLLLKAVRNLQKQTHFATCLHRRVFTVSAIRILLLPLHSSVQHCIAVLPWHISFLLMQIVVYAVITMILPVCLLCHGFKMLWILVISHVSATFYMRL